MARARRVQHREAVAVRIGRPRPTRVPTVGRARDEIEQAVTTAAEEHAGPWQLERRRDVHGVDGLMVRAGERIGAAAQQIRDDVERFAEPLEPDARARQRHTDRVVFRFVPSRAEPDVDTAATDAIECRKRFGRDRRRAERLAQHQCAEPDAFDDT